MRLRQRRKPNNKVFGKNFIFVKKAACGNGANQAKIKKYEKQQKLLEIGPNRAGDLPAMLERSTLYSKSRPDICLMPKPCFCSGKKRKGEKGKNGGGGSKTKHIIYIYIYIYEYLL